MDLEPAAPFSTTKLPPNGLLSPLNLTWYVSMYLSTFLFFFLFLNFILKREILQQQLVGRVANTDGVSKFEKKLFFFGVVGSWKIETYLRDHEI